MSRLILRAGVIALAAGAALGLYGAGRSASLERCGPLWRRRREALVTEIDLQRRAIAMTNDRLSDVMSSLEDLRRQTRGTDREPERISNRVVPKLSRAVREDQPIAIRLER